MQISNQYNRQLHPQEETLAQQLAAASNGQYMVDQIEDQDGGGALGGAIAGGGSQGPIAGAGLATNNEVYNRQLNQCEKAAEEITQLM